LALKIWGFKFFEAQILPVILNGAPQDVALNAIAWSGGKDPEDVSIKMAAIKALARECGCNASW
jgi:hypothetical protein